MDLIKHKKPDMEGWDDSAIFRVNEKPVKGQSEYQFVENDSFDLLFVYLIQDAELVATKDTKEAYRVELELDYGIIYDKTYMDYEIADFSYEDIEFYNDHKTGMVDFQILESE